MSEEYRDKYSLIKSLAEKGKKQAMPLQHIEFICPKCGGIATVFVENGYMISECHADGIGVKVRV